MAVGRRTPGGANGVTGRVSIGRAYYNFCCTADPALAHVRVVIVVLIVIIVTVVVIVVVM